MHVGRLRVYFVPYTNTSGLTAENLSNTASTIIDIEQQTTVSFTIPYVFTNPWCETIGFTGTPKSIGTLRIAVLNELNHPVVPVPAVFVNVWVMAGPDFQLARPAMSGLRLNLYQPPPPMMQEEEFLAQGLTRDAIRAMPAPTLIPAGGSVEHNICQADEFTHIKELIMRPSYIGTTTINAAPTYSKVVINPQNPVRRLTAADGTVNYYNYFRCIFRYMRGSNKIGLLQTNPYTTFTENHSLVSNGMNTSDGAALGFPVFGTTTFITAPIALGSSFSDGVSYAQTAEFPQVATLPYYSTMYGITNAAWYGGTTPFFNWNVYGSINNAILYTRNICNVALFAGDDMEFVYLVGAPALTLSGA
jgi:hypothetical protein